MGKTIFFLIIICVLSVDCASTGGKIANYFKSDVFKNFQKLWQTQRKSYENAILLALKENFGFRGMNVYVRRTPNTLRISDGFLSSDNVVGLLLSDITLTSLPQLIMPEVTFALASNVLSVEAGLSKMIIETKYSLFRNHSDIIYTAAQDPYKNSPFSYQQVDNTGQLAIIAEDCTLTGFTLTRLSGHTINIGHDTFHVKDCKFSVEISANRNKGPPVIAPYFSQEQGKQLENLLTRPIREELMPKLQAAVFTYINTSLIFGDYLPTFREYQDDIYKETISNVTKFVRNIINVTVTLNEDTAELNPEEISWDQKCQERSCLKYISIDNVTLHSLDTLYSSHSGGPYKLQVPKTAEAFRFNLLLVRGTIRLDNNTVNEEHDFVAEIKDTTVNIDFDMEKSNPLFKVSNWRNLELSVAALEHDSRNRRTANAFITGYLINNLPRFLENHLNSVSSRLTQSYSPSNPDQKMSNVNVNCNNVGGGGYWGFPGYYYWG